MSYQLAEKYQLPTVAKMDKRYAASQAITRGKMAHILATAHYKKLVNTSIGLRFMFKSKLTASKRILNTHSKVNLSVDKWLFSLRSMMNYTINK